MRNLIGGLILGVSLVAGTAAAEVHVVVNVPVPVVRVQAPAPRVVVYQPAPRRVYVIEERNRGNNGNNGNRGNGHRKHRR